MNRLRTAESYIQVHYHVKNTFNYLVTCSLKSYAFILMNHVGNSSDIRQNIILLGRLRVN